MKALLDALRSAVGDPWESFARVVELHAGEDWGDVAAEGSAAWHLHHTVDCFRFHASKASGGALAWDDALPRDAAGLRDALSGAVERYAEWVEGQSAARLSETVRHDDREMDVAAMTALMVRHVIWHAARARGEMEGKARRH